MLVALLTGGSLAACSTDQSDDDAASADSVPSISASCDDDQDDVIRSGTYDLPKLDGDCRALR